MDNVSMIYGAYNFEPVPFIRLGRTANKTGAGEIIGFSWQLNLSGDLVAAPTGGIITIDDKQDELTNALAEQGKLFRVECNGSEILSVYPRINTVDFEQGIWVHRSPYTVDMEFDTAPTGTGSISYISDYSEDWSFEFIDEKTAYEWTLPGSVADALPTQIRITHNLSATGKSIYDSTGFVKSAFKQAKNYIKDRLGIDNEFIENSGVINLSAANFSGFNHFRSVNANEAGGTYSVNESWIYISDESGVAGHAIEDFTVTIRTANETPIRSVNIEGSVQGLETRVYGSNPNDFTVSETKYDAAVDYWNIVKTRLIGRGNLVLDGVSVLRDLNIVPVSTSEGHNIYNGTIQYSYEYNDRPSNCLTDALFENITITDNNPADLFATIFILGRANGPVLQNLNTTTAATRSLQIEAIYEPPSGCPTSESGIALWLGFQNKSPTDAEDVVDAIEAQLESAYDQVFRHEDTQSWTPRDGRYSRNVSWTFGSC